MRKGFTLIELLVSIAIFSILVALAVYSFRFDIGLVKKVVFPYPKEAIEFSYLNDIIKSMFYYVGVKRDVYNKKNFFLYFYGNKKSMKFISMTEEGPKLFMLYKKGNVLKLKETKVYSKFNNYLNPFFPSKGIEIKTLFDDVDNIDITYFVNSRKYATLKEIMPTLVKISILEKNKKLTFFFKIKSSFNEKLNYAEFFHSVYQ